MTEKAADQVATVPRLDARNLSIGYHGHAIVHDLTLTVDPGEVVALVGPNGAGKSTTLMALAGYLQPLGGEVRIGGDVTDSPLYARAKAGLSYVPETRGIFKGLSVSENLRLARADVETALGLFPELEPLQDRNAGALSGGEQQMLSLARALSRGANLLLVDELSLGLAPMIVTRLLDAISAAAANDQVGVLLVEQHVQQVLRVADRVYVLRRGELVKSGTVDEVRPHLKDAYL